MQTTFAKTGEVAERWLLYDASQHVLGRLAAEIAQALMGKDRPSYTPNQLCGAHVVVIHAEKVQLTGRKLEQKIYERYSGYPGGLREIEIAHVLEHNPTEVVRLAVKRMLPKTKLGRAMLGRLKVYAGAEHPHTAQKPTPVEAKKR